MRHSEKKLRPGKIRSKGGLAKLGYSPREIEQRTAVIYNKVLTHSQNLDDGNFTRFGTDDLKRLFELYDRHFFNNFFTKNHGDKIIFRLSKRMTRSGGKTSYLRKSKTFQICLSTTLIFQTFNDVTREVKVNGIVCHDQLEAVMRILEHEMIHLMELVLFERSSCSKPQFRLFSRNIFNHSDGQFVDSNGNRYGKYYVPLPLLTPAKGQVALEIPTQTLRSKQKY